MAPISRSSDAICLPAPRTTGRTSLEQAIAFRRSVRRYARDPLSLSGLGQLLWAGQGITDQAGGLRAAPSAGATYPLELLAFVGEAGVTGLDAGVYEYLPERHSLHLLHPGDRRPELSAAALQQSFIQEAPASILICANFARTARHYGERALRYVYLEAGHAAQNIALQAVALGLASVPAGAFNDAAVRGLIGRDQAPDPVYLVSAGRLL